MEETFKAFINYPKFFSLINTLDDDFLVQIILSFLSPVPSFLQSTNLNIQFAISLLN